MGADDQRGKSGDVEPQVTATSLLAETFRKGGWQVRAATEGAERTLTLRRKGVEYAALVKSASEGRGDRLVPLFAQAVLQAAHAAGGKAVPLAIVSAPRISRRAAAQILAFAERYAPDTAAGVIDHHGFAAFRGTHLEGLNAEGAGASPSVRQTWRDSGALFSDLNQWMLKVLLAPELPDALLVAPRGQYRNATQLARAASVSVMSAFRFVQQLQREGYLHESSAPLRLVRRADLFRRWLALPARAPREVAMRFLLPGAPQAQLRRMLASGRACLALFAAADALNMGFVSGVPPYVYVSRLQPASLAAWRSLRACSPGEAPDVIVRQAPAPQSVFRGHVRPDGVPACDVLQVWLDVAAHPSRGQEQADLIRKRVLERIIDGAR